MWSFACRPCIAWRMVSVGAAAPVPCPEIATESVIASTVVPCLSFASTVACERIIMSIRDVIVVSTEWMFRVPTISTDCSKRVYIVSPTRGWMRSITICALEGIAPATSAAATMNARASRRGAGSDRVRIIVGEGLDRRARHRRRGRCRNDLSELRLEVRGGLLGRVCQRRVERAQHIFVLVETDHVLHPRERERGVEASQLAQHPNVEGHVGRLRKALHAIAPAHHGRAREGNEDRLCEVRVTNHQLSLRQRSELRARGGAQHGVAGRRELIAC